MTQKPQQEQPASGTNRCECTHSAKRHAPRCRAYACHCTSYKPVIKVTGCGHVRDSVCPDCAVRYLKILRQRQNSLNRAKDRRLQNSMLIGPGRIMKPTASAAFMKRIKSMGGPKSWQ